jgi:hypothetical protein
MSENDFEVDEVFNEDTKRIEEQPVKEEEEKKEPVVVESKRTMTEEKRQKMLENLKKGRETAKKNRELRKSGKLPPKQATGLSKKMEIKETNVNVVKEITEDLSNATIMNSIESLKQELKELKKQPKTVVDNDEIKQLKEEIAQLRKEAKKNIIKEEVKPPPSNPVPIPQPQNVVHSTYVPNIWSKFTS